MLSIMSSVIAVFKRDVEMGCRRSGNQWYQEWKPVIASKDSVDRLWTSSGVTHCILTLCVVTLFFSELPGKRDQRWRCVSQHNANPFCALFNVGHKLSDI